MGRYAIYFASEPGSALARFGAAWLGYDVANGEAVAQLAVARVARERLEAITSEPRRYGFHATLKPPFVLAEGTDAVALDIAVRRLADEITAFAAPPLRLACLSGFWALMLSTPCPAMDRLAARCVEALDRFRAPPSAAELAQRRRAGLSPRQEMLLERWGYPYVMDEFRFHMTLSARLERAERDSIGAALAPLAEPFMQPLPVDAVGLFHQPSREAPFRLLHRYRLAGAA